MHTDKPPRFFKEGKVVKIPTSKCEDAEEAAAAAPPSHPPLLIKFANGKPSSMGQLKPIHPKTNPVTRVKVRRARNAFAERGAR